MLKTRVKLTAEKLAIAGQALVPYYPVPDTGTIDYVINCLCRAFDVPFSVESDAKNIWRKKVGLN